MPPVAPRLPLVPEDRLRDRPAVHLTRAVAATAAVALGKAKSVDAVLADRWPGDRIAPMIAKASTSPTTLSGFGAAVVVNAVRDFIGTLASYGAAAKLIAAGLTVDLTGVAQMLIPRRIAAVDPSLAWVGEGAPIPIRDYSLAASTLAPRKLAVGAGFTFEMSQSEPIVETILREDCAASLDSSMFSATPGDATRPPGILDGVAALPASSAGGSAVMAADIGALLGAVSGEAVLILPPQLAAATYALPRVPTIWISEALAPDVAIAVNPRAFVSGFGAEPTIEASKETAVVFQDTAPVPPIFDASGTPGNPVRSFFQADLVALKLTLPAAWALRQPTRAVAWMSGVTWK